MQWFGRGILMSTRKVVMYFNDPGEVNSAETLKAAKERADELNIRDIVVAVRGERLVCWQSTCLRATTLWSCLTSRA